jgi:hypothetical protein
LTLIVVVVMQGGGRQASSSNDDLVVTSPPPSDRIQGVQHGTASGRSASGHDEDKRVAATTTSLQPFRPQSTESKAFVMVLLLVVAAITHVVAITITIVATIVHPPPSLL